MEEKSEKAIEAVAKVTPRLLDSVDALGCFVERTFGYPIEAATEFLGDWIKFKRENWLMTVTESKRIVDARGIEDIEPMPAKYAAEIIEKASLEDDELLQKMWAGLIVSSLDPSISFQPSKIIIHVLGELEPLDARMLKFLRSVAINESPYPHGMGYNLFRLMESVGGDERSVSLSVLNLERLSLIHDAVEKSKEEGAALVYALTHQGAMVRKVGPLYEISALGRELIDVCILTESV